MVLRGKGKGFCAKADLAAIIESDDGEDPDLDAYPRETYGCLVAPLRERSWRMVLG